ncbi:MULTISPECIES: type II toxin-antitoxin system prevent-host-death family antitoxin [unclassified Nocardia]|uniref:type II toxin-antitoxin system Phd/YefM family antitoxin n=1 Tax=unclassified Nocardia TaxID=2637762 RepID=UPI003413B4AA
MGIPAELPEIPQRELRNEASRILREVRAGQSYTVTVDGAAVADLVPHRPARRRTAVPRDETIAAFAGLSGSDDQDFVDDSLYDPYDRAYRRGEFAPGSDS